MLTFFFWLQATVALLQNGTENDEASGKAKQSLGVFTVVQVMQNLCITM